MYACGAGAGLMVISVAKKIGASVNVGVILVVALALGNGGGRIAAGMISDKIGRALTMFGFFVLQAIVIVMLAMAATEASALATATVLVALAAVAGANYGSNLTLFPSITKDFYGLKNFGMNYGFIFTAWGVGGFMLAQLAGKVYDQTKSFSFAFYCSAGLLLIAAIMTFIVRAPHHEVAVAEAEVVIEVPQEDAAEVEELAGVES